MTIPSEAGANALERVETLGGLPKPGYSPRHGKEKVQTTNVGARHAVPDGRENGSGR